MPRVAILELFSTSSQKSLHPGAENAKSCLLNNDDIGNIKFDVVLVSAASIQQNDFLDSFDIIILPGGNSAQQAQHLKPEGLSSIRSFVENGGGYVGICAGAYLALSHYQPQRSLGLLRAGALSDWKRGHFRVPVEFLPQGLSLLNNVKLLDQHVDDSYHSFQIKKENDVLVDKKLSPSPSKINEQVLTLTEITSNQSVSMIGQIDSSPSLFTAGAAEVQSSNQDNNHQYIGRVRFNNGPCIIPVALLDTEEEANEGEGGKEVKEGVGNFKNKKMENDSRRRTEESSDNNAHTIKSNRSNNEHVINRTEHDLMNSKNCNVLDNKLDDSSRITSLPLSPPRPGEPTWLAKYSYGIKSSQFMSKTTIKQAVAVQNNNQANKNKSPKKDDDDDMDDDESIDTYAAISGKFGKGRVLLLSPHFESTPIQENSISKTCAMNLELKTIVRNAVVWASNTET